MIFVVRSEVAVALRDMAEWSYYLIEGWVHPVDSVMLGERVDSVMTCMNWRMSRFIDSIADFVDPE